MVTKQQSLFEEVEKQAVQKQQNEPVNEQKHNFKQTEIGEMPESWQVVKLGDVCEKIRFNSINPQNYKDETFEYYSIPSYQETGKPSFTLGKEIQSNKLIIDELTILFGKLNPRVPKIWLSDQKSEYRKICSTEFLPVITNQKASYDFLYFLSWSKFILPLAQTLVSGSTPSRQRVEPTRFYKILIPLPPIDEQKRIAEVLTTIQNNKQALKKELELEQERKAALMEKLFREGLNNEPLKQTEIGEMPESWQVVKLGDVCHSFQYGSSKKSSREGQIPILRMGNIQNGEIDWTDLVYSSDDEEIAKYQLASNIVLFNRTNSPDLVGKTAIYKGEKPALFAGYLIRINNNSELLDPFFLNYIMNTSRTKEWRLSVKSDSCSQSNINAKKLASFLLQLPSLKEQKQIAELLLVCDDKIQALKKEINLIDELFQSMLNDLMRGRVRV